MTMPERRKIQLRLVALNLIGVLAVARRLGRMGLGFFVLLLSNLFVTLWAAAFNERNMDLLGYLSFGSGMAILCAVAGFFWGVRRLAEGRLIWASKAAWGVPLLTALLVFPTGIRSEEHATRLERGVQFTQHAR